MNIKPVTGMWSTGFCDCCAEPGGCGTCFYTCCCPCCQYGQNVARMPADMVCCGGSCYGACCCYFMMHLIGCPCLLHMNTRSWVRVKYGIPGDCCQDCMATWCCALCAICQEHRELTCRLVQQGGAELKDNKVSPAPQQQQPQVVMMAAPPASYPAASPYPPPYGQQPPPGYGAPQPQYAPPPPQYAPPPAQAYPPPGYGAPPPAYAAPPPAYGAPAYGAPAYAAAPQPVQYVAVPAQGHHHRRRSGSSSSSDEE
ncbi:hypothetical protein CHLRE_02g145900v5 [Chlamydomonas reinhardtii]|uniref:Uncharacterized protein n=1 Tax=Chlamydomonas reinhardtii TaxID=3055 RepID=A8J0X1_CHLRE|nr:uncharacterized protein CHLRE_02g145900v5 [Chlamydomonas reinhardtii]PNW87425.1 hypothetical protein CHLRE_02g145900v5 [Chlamydomonas reinhardtii]|eukprot:XP_001694887.1 predicted protein [Chlamydomonas reinhardtii]